MIKILGLIPARGGSKGIPKKNIHMLAGKPLLAYTCNSAYQSKFISRTLLSTDSKEIADVGIEHSIEVPFLRPDDISGDLTPSIDVVLHALNWLEENENWQPDAVILLQPTSPLRLARHIDEAIEIFIKESADTVVSVVPVPHRYNPYSVMICEEGQLHDFLKIDDGIDKYRRQELPVLYARNGPAVLITKIDTIKSKRRFYGTRVLPYVMEEKYSIDIDDPLDLQIAEHLIRLEEGDY